MPRENKQQRLERQAREEAEKIKAHADFQAALPTKILYEFIPKLLERGIDFDFIPNHQHEDGKLCISFGDSGWISLRDISEWEYEAYFNNFITGFDNEQEEKLKVENIRKETLKMLTQEQKDAIRGFV